MAGSGGAALTIRPVTADDWAGFREIRLRMLADTPIAFEERLADAEQVSERRWRERAGRGGDFVRFAALNESTGRWSGTMGCVLSAVRPELAMLIGVYIEPEERGAGGLTDRMLDVVEAWAARRSTLMGLFVHEDNARARRAYEKRGWRLTGARTPYPMDPRRSELEMVKTLGERTVTPSS